MRKTLTVLAVVLAACSPAPEPAAPEPEPTIRTEIAPEPTPTPAPAPAPAPAPEPREPYTYGDDDRLDILWTRCDSGDLDACNTLFWDSPLNSRYEQFALDKIDELTATPPLRESEVVDMLGVGPILDVVWADMTRQERADLCDGVALFGADLAAGLIVESSGMDMPVRDVAAWLTQACR